MNYLMIVPIKYYRINDKEVMLESAFIEHLRLLKNTMKLSFNNLTVALIEVNDIEAKDNKSFSTLNEETEKIFIRSMCNVKDIEISQNWIKNIIIFYLFHFLSYAKKIIELVRESDLVHAGPAHIAQVPVFFSILVATILTKKSISVVDIDFRNSAWMSLQTGNLSRKSYFLSKYIYDSIFSIQIKFSVLFCSLILLKGKKLVQDYGKGNPKVKNFLDSAYSQDYIISKLQLSRKVLYVQDPNNPLEIVYFGRLVDYKGIDHCINAINKMQKITKRNVIFHIIGSGTQETVLKQLVGELQMSNVIFHEPIPYGLKLFEQLYNCHLLLAAPLSEDTPRSALDSMAAGVPIVAFDTYYYKDLEDTGAVVTVPWLSTEKMAQKIADLDNKRDILIEMMEKAVAFAHENTQEIWLNKRWQWTLEAMDNKVK